MMNTETSFLSLSIYSLALSLCGHTIVVVVVIGDEEIEHPKVDDNLTLTSVTMVETSRIPTSKRAVTTNVAGGGQPLTSAARTIGSCSTRKECFIC
ncbi:hypothetical protein TIFTF001_015797 [Ficus carica]|uniref:Secreted protein n=1 Tax=Ficus carica TaxID=3494 RepID=A0AA88A6B2_FICCA|nr:hypothetical protein TIFTF001_015797 [Ficus carica]